MVLLYFVTLATKQQCFETVFCDGKTSTKAFISGEVSEQTTHIVNEMDIHFFAAGHHATERYGIKALGEHIAKNLALTVEFIDIDNPV